MAKDSAGSVVDRPAVLTEEPIPVDSPEATQTAGAAGAVAATGALATAATPEPTADAAAGAQAARPTRTSPPDRAGGHAPTGMRAAFSKRTHRAASAPPRRAPAPTSAQPSATPASGVVARGFVDQYRDNVTSLGAAQLSGVGVPPYTRFVARPLGRRLAAMAAILRLTPNGVTALSLLWWALGLALLCLAEPSTWVGVAVAVVLLVGDALDSADGQLARLARRDGPVGAWVDRLADQLRSVTVHLAVLIWLYRYAELATPLPYLLPLGWVIVGTAMATGQVRRHGHSTAASDPATRHGGLRALALLPTETGLLCLAFVLIGTPSSVLWVYGVLLALNALVALVALRRRYVELRRETRRAG